MQSVARKLLRRSPRKDVSNRGFWQNCKYGTVDMRWFAVASAAFLAASFIYGSYLGDGFEQVKRSLRLGAANISGVVGLTVETVTLTGRNRASDAELLAALDIQRGDSMLKFNTAEARTRLEKIGWVSKASVHRLFPNTVLIDIEERSPYAIWQRGGRLSIIDKKGTTLGALRVKDHGYLPLVVGYGAEDKAQEIYSQLAAYPGLKSLVRAAVRVADRRWNLRLLNGITINLPETGVPEALAQLAKLDEDNGLLSRDIVLVDFRIVDRVTIRLSDEAAQRRAAAYSENAAKSKKAGKRKT